MPSEGNIFGPASVRLSVGSVSYFLLFLLLSEGILTLYPFAGRQTVRDLRGSHALGCFHARLKGRARSRLLRDRVSVEPEAATGQAATERWRSF